MILNKKDMLRVLTTKEPNRPHVREVKIRIEGSSDANPLVVLDVEPDQCGIAIINNDLVRSVAFTSYYNGRELLIEAFYSKETVNTIDDYYESVK